MSLPRLRPLSEKSLWVFDLRHGLGVTWGILRHELGLRRALWTLFYFLKRRAGRDPLASLPSSPLFKAREEALSRHQFRPVVILEDVLRCDMAMSQEETLPVLSRVIREVGARFLAISTPRVDREAWAGAGGNAREVFASGLVKRLFNAWSHGVKTGAFHLEFTVGHCRFMEMSHALGRPYLAPLFCAADGAFF